jgi:hypothetical protein
MLKWNAWQNGQKDNIMEYAYMKLLAEYYGLYLERDLQLKCYVLGECNGSFVSIPYTVSEDRLRALCEAWHGDYTGTTL